MRTAIIAFAATQVAFYLILSFVAWDWWWIYQVDDFHRFERAAVLFVWMIVSAVSVLVALIIEETKR